jgi:hypothetical protein
VKKTQIINLLTGLKGVCYKNRLESEERLASLTTEGHVVRHDHYSYGIRLAYMHTGVTEVVAGFVKVTFLRKGHVLDRRLSSSKKVTLAE